MAKWIWYFGYAEHEGNDRTGFFKFDKPTEEQKKSFAGFRKQNETAIKEVISLGDKSTYSYAINSGVTPVDVCDDWTKSEMNTL